MQVINRLETSQYEAKKHLRILEVEYLHLTIEGLSRHLILVFLHLNHICVMRDGKKQLWLEDHEDQKTEGR